MKGHVSNLIYYSAFDWLTSTWVWPFHVNLFSSFYYYFKYYFFLFLFFHGHAEFIHPMINNKTTAAYWFLYLLSFRRATYLKATFLVDLFTCGLLFRSLRQLDIYFHFIRHVYLASTYLVDTSSSRLLFTINKVYVMPTSSQCLLIWSIY